MIPPADSPENSSAAGVPLEITVQEARRRMAEGAVTFG